MTPSPRLARYFLGNDESKWRKRRARTTRHHPTPLLTHARDVAIAFSHLNRGPMPSKISLLPLLLCLCALPSNLLSQMSGVYTIDPTGSGSRNFTTIQAAVLTMPKGQHRGFCRTLRTM